MDYTVGYLLALAVVATGFIGVILALIVLEVSRWKFAVSLILSLVLVGLGGYYYFVVGQSEKGVPDANKLRWSAAVQEFSPMTWGKPAKSENSFSNRAVTGPVVRNVDRNTSDTLSISFSDRPCRKNSTFM